MLSISFGLTLESSSHSVELTGGRVTVKLHQQNDEVRLDVSDTGLGVAVVDQPYLFTPFFRANNEATFEVAGVGLGLFITRSIIEWHEGRVWAESKLGAGSTFSLVLPVFKTQTSDK